MRNELDAGPGGRPPGPRRPERPGPELHIWRLELTATDPNGEERQAGHDDRADRTAGRGSAARIAAHRDAVARASQMSGPDAEGPAGRGGAARIAVDGAPVAGADRVSAAGAEEAQELGADEERRAARLPTPGARRRFRRARMGLRRILGAYLDLPPADVPLEQTTRGKPQLRAPAPGSPALPFPLFFNLSHSGELALVAVTEAGEVGVDVERIRRLRFMGRLVERHFTAEERAAAEDWEAAAAVPAFFRIWARKEALAKASGVGVARGLYRADTIRGLCDGEAWWLRDLSAGEGFAAAVACAHAPPTVRQWHLGPLAE